MVVKTRLTEQVRLQKMASNLQILRTGGLFRDGPSDRGENQPVTPPGRKFDTGQAVQEEYVRLVEYIRTSLSHETTSTVLRSLQDLDG